MPYVVSPDVVWAEDTDEVKLYHAGRGDFQTLNSSAAEIWRMVVAGTSTVAVAAELVSRYGAEDAAESSTVARDVEEFIGTLVRLGLLVEGPPGADADDVVAG